MYIVVQLHDVWPSIYIQLLVYTYLAFYIKSRSMLLNTHTVYTNHYMHVFPFIHNYVVTYVVALPASYVYSISM